MSIYDSNQPAAFGRFRDATGRMASMPGVTMASFRCKGCGVNKVVKGRKRVTAGTNKDGYLCADCAPAAVAEPPVAQKPVSRAVASKPTPEPAKARKLIMTDEQVLECRAAFEFEGATKRSLERKYGAAPAYMRQLLGYEVRSKLIPAQHRTRSP